MIDFAALDHETRAVALVGQFLQLWATMEQSLGRAIGAALELNNISQFVLMANLGFLNKVFTLGAICAASDLPEDELKNAKILLNQIQNYYGNRNIVAHTLFIPSDKSDGVQFLAWRARGKLSFPEGDWSVDVFNQKFHDLSDFTKGLLYTEQGLRRVSRVSSNAMIALLSAIPSAPTEGLSGLAGLAPPFPQPPTGHTSATSAANRGTRKKRPPSPER